jgi:hypothetical protein
MPNEKSRKQHKFFSQSRCGYKGFNPESEFSVNLGIHARNKLIIWAVSYLGSIDGNDAGRGKDNSSNGSNQ